MSASKPKLCLDDCIGDVYNTCVYLYEIIVARVIAVIAAQVVAARPARVIAARVTISE